MSEHSVKLGAIAKWLRPGDRFKFDGDELEFRENADGYCYTNGRWGSVPHKQEIVPISPRLELVHAGETVVAGDVVALYPNLRKFREWSARCGTTTCCDRLRLVRDEPEVLPRKMPASDASLRPGDVVAFPAGGIGILSRHEDGAWWAWAEGQERMPGEELLVSYPGDMLTLLSRAALDPEPETIVVTRDNLHPGDVVEFVSKVRGGSIEAWNVWAPYTISTMANNWWLVLDRNGGHAIGFSVHFGDTVRVISRATQQPETEPSHAGQEPEVCFGSSIVVGDRFGFCEDDDFFGDEFVALSPTEARCVKSCGKEG